MSMDLEHISEVGVKGYPAVVTKVTAPDAAPAPVPAASKSDKGGKAPKEADVAPPAGKKEKGAKAAKDVKAAAPSVPAGPPPAEKSAAELAKMSKEERTAYHMARRAGGAQAAPGAGNATAKVGTQLTKAERRAVQDSQRKVKEDKQNEGKDGDELLEELKLQGLSDQKARDVMAAMKAGESLEGAEEDDDDDDEDLDELIGAVRAWMIAQAEVIPDDAVQDFNMKVRFQGHVNTTPPDHLGCVLEILVEQACKDCDLASPKMQPGAMAKTLAPAAERWASILRGLYTKVPDVLEAVNVVVETISETVLASGAPAHGQDCAVVGCLMAIREIDDLMEDEDLLVGCKGMEPRSRVLEKFIEFLEEACEEEDDEDDDGDD